MNNQKLEQAEWVQSEHGLSLKHITELNVYGNKIVGEVELLIEQRPVYCDRGHYTGKVFGITSIDEADFFPRFYMRLSVAKAEMKEWLQWRLYKIDRWNEL